MAAAYAALVSLLNTITLEQIPRLHPPHQISFDGGILQSLWERVNFLVGFLEQEWRGAQDLEDQIVDAAYAAEDAIDSYIAGQILGESTSHNDEGYVRLFHDLEKIIRDMDSFKTEAMQIKHKTRKKDLHLSIKISAGPSSSPPHYQKNKMVGFDDQKAQLMKLIAADQAKRQVIAIVGMGGMGKTTLVRNVYDDNYMVHCFDIRVWISVSQEYSVRDILEKALGMTNETTSIGMYEDIYILGNRVHQKLYGRKYLIIFDNIWSIDVWNEIKRFFPDNNNHSRVVVTTRFSNVANECSTSSITMKFLDEESSWNLLCQKAFAQRSCPIELVEIGKRIAKNCRGLPLSIATIGGLLAKSGFTRKCWEQVAADVQSTMDLDMAQHCLKVLQSSVDHLPVHLKPCLLYMGIFSDDYEIRVSELSRLWIAEGFLKPIRDKSLEEIAEKYFKDLVERNLILGGQRVLNGKIKVCYIHDLVRDLCLREAHRRKFFYDTRCSLNDPWEITNGHRRFSLNRRTSRETQAHQIHCFVGSTPIIRSLTCNSIQVLPLESPKFLRILNERAINEVYTFPRKHHEGGYYTRRVLARFINSRYVASNAPLSFNAENTLPCLLRNLQTLVSRRYEAVMAPSEIWNMQQLRHAKFNAIRLPEPPSGDIVLENLQTFMTLENFRFHQEVVKRILNIRKLKVRYTDDFWHIYKGSQSHYNLNHLGHLEKLRVAKFHYRLL